MSNLNVAKMVAEVVAENAAKVAKMLKYDKMVSELEAAGVDVHRLSEWDVKFLSFIDVQASELPAVRKVVGRLSVVGKDTAWDFDTTNELSVTVRPKSDDYPFSFRYRTKYRKGGKCEVVTSATPPQVRTNLVCKV